MRGPTRYLIPALFLSWSGVLTAVVSSTPRSTYICPGFLPYRHTVPTFQWLGVFLECFIFIAIAEFCVSKTSDGLRKGSRGPFILGWMYIVSSSDYLSGLSPSDLQEKITAVILGFAGIATILVKEEFGSWVQGFHKSYVSSLVGQTVLFSIVSICAMQLVRLQLKSSESSSDHIDDPCRASRSCTCFPFYPHFRNRGFCWFGTGPRFSANRQRLRYILRMSIVSGFDYVLVHQDIFGRT